MCNPSTVLCAQNKSAPKRTFSSRRAAVHLLIQSRDERIVLTRGCTQTHIKKKCMEKTQDALSDRTRAASETTTLSTCIVRLRKISLSLRVFFMRDTRTPAHKELSCARPLIFNWNFYDSLLPCGAHHHHFAIAAAAELRHNKYRHTVHNYKHITCNSSFSTSTAPFRHSTLLSIAGYT